MPDDPKVPVDSETKRLQLEKTKAETEKAVIEAHKAKLAAALPASDTKPLEGKVDVAAGVGLVAQLLAYKLLDPAAETIAKVVEAQVEPKKAPSKGAQDNANELPSILVVEDRALTATDWPHGAILAQLKSHKNTLDKMTTSLDEDIKEDRETIPEHAAAEQERPVAEPQYIVGPVAISAASTMLGHTATLLGMFRSDYSISSKDVKIGTTPLVAAVVQHLLNKSVRVNVDQFALLKETGIVKDFWDAREKRFGLEALAIQLKIKKRHPEDVTQAEAVIAQFDGFSAAVTAASKESTYPPLIAAALREALHDGPPQQTHVLYVAIEGSGGETVTRRSLFSWGGRVAFMGGTQVSYMLLQARRNEVLAAGTETLLGHMKYKPYKGEPGNYKRVELTLG